MKLPIKQLKQIPGKRLFEKQYVGYVGFTGIACLILSGIAWILQMRFGAISALFSIIGLACILAYVLIDFKNILALFSKRSVKYGTNVTVMILIVLGIVILVEAISSRHNFRLDLTRNKRFTLSDQTNKVLNALDQDVNVLAFFSLDQGGREAFQDLLNQYTHASARIKYEFVDPDKNPGRAKSYEIRSYGTIVLETAEKQEKILESTEEALTNALIKVTRKGKKVVYFLIGHGEHALNDVGERGFNQVQKAIEDENYEPKELLLLQQASVPDDATILIIAGPEKDLVPAELEALKTYIQRGGKILFMLDPEQAQGMMAFLKEYGIILGDDLVIDTLSRVFGASYDMPVVSQYREHPITEKFSVATFFPVARSVQVEDSPPEGVTAQILASSSPQSWAEANKKDLQRGRVEFNEGSDLQGPVPVAAVSTIELKTEESRDKAETRTKTKKARLVVFGDSDFASNTYLGLSGNGDLFLNAVSWLAEEEDLIAIRAKNPESSPLMMSAPQGQFAFFLSIILLPGIVIIIGITVFIKRRKATR